MTATRQTSQYIGSLVVAAALATAGALVVRAQTETIGSAADARESKGIVFPVAELGGCMSKTACRAYCGEESHMEACIAFARAHGLMNEEEAVRAEKFHSKLGEGGGPGGCASPASCEAFCRAIENLDACISFAEDHGVNDRHVEEGKKIREYLKSGGAMPGGCSSKETCEAYCGDFSHAEECFSFSKKAGIGRDASDENPGTENGDGAPSPEQFKRFAELAKKGETPGGCKSKNECETFCRDQAHFEECIRFAEQAGLVTTGEAERIRTSGGKGPGGCSSPDTCRSYCADQAHRDECYRFGKEHGFIKEEDEQRMKEGLVRMKAGLDQAPAEVRECVRSNVGENIIEDIQAGKLTPGPEIGQRLRGCFDKFGDRGEAGDFAKQAPPKVAVCLKEKIGDAFNKVAKGEEQPTPEMADAFRVCNQLVQFNEGGKENEAGGETVRGGEGGLRPQGPRRGPADFLRTAPPEVASCLKEKLGGDIEKLQSEGTNFGPELKDKVRSCFESFRPGQEMNQDGPKSSGEKGLEGDRGKMMRGPASPKPWGEGGRVMPQGAPNIPPETLNCIRENIGTDAFRSLMGGSKPEGGVEAKIGDCFSRTNREGENRPPENRQFPQGGQFPPNNEGGIMPPLQGMQPQQEMRSPQEIQPQQEMQFPSGDTNTAPQSRIGTQNPFAIILENFGLLFGK